MKRTLLAEWHVRVYTHAELTREGRERAMEALATPDVEGEIDYAMADWLCRNVPAGLYDELSVEIKEA